MNDESGYSEMESVVTAKSNLSSVSSVLNSQMKLTPLHNTEANATDHSNLQRTIDRAKEGKTFFPESVEFLKSSSPILTRDSNHQFTFTMGESSTPMLDKTKQMQFNFTKGNIFNPTPSIISSNPEIKASADSNGIINPVKGAFNMFDKNSSFGSMSSLTSRPFKRPRKRVRPTSADNSIISNDGLLPGFQPTQKQGQGQSQGQGQNQNTITTQKKPKQAHSVLEFFKYLISDPQYAENIAILFQYLLNSLFVIVSLIMVGFVILGIKKDVDTKISQYKSSLINEVNACKREYLRNNCSPEMRVPALEHKCNEWDNCMSQDPLSVITSVAYFEVIADCMNAFFQKLTFRTISGVGVIFIICFIIPNFMFTRLRLASSTIQNTSVSESPKKQTIMLGLNDGDGDGTNNSIVRFNPNVSYSFYDKESELSIGEQLLRDT